MKSITYFDTVHIVVRNTPGGGVHRMFCEFITGGLFHLLYDADGIARCRVLLVTNLINWILYTNADSNMMDKTII